jgi:hypothetical protein
MKTIFKIWLLCALLAMCIGCVPKEEDPTPKIPDQIIW